MEDLIVGINGEWIISGGVKRQLVMEDLGLIELEKIRLFVKYNLGQNAIMGLQFKHKDKTFSSTLDFDKVYFQYFCLFVIV